MLNLGKVGTQIGQQHVRGSIYNTYQLHAPPHDVPTPAQTQADTLRRKIEFRQSCIRSLDFDSSGERVSAIKTAHKSTCRWLLTCPEFHDWLDAEIRWKHHGFLWIKGKPGTGKSTIMKFISTKAMEDATYGTLLTFFFNARGDQMGKSVQGLYQSLLFSLTVSLPETQKVFDGSYVIGRTATPRWTIDTLQLAIESAIRMLGGQAVTCLVDALDECDNDDVRDMVRFFEDLSEIATEHNVHLCICFSSRHYPHITVRHGLQIVLEDQPEHQLDVERYIYGELQLGDSLQAQNIRKTMLTKARGNFLWIRLVVAMLNARWDKGRLRGLEDILERIPGRLEQLFDDIVQLHDGMDDVAQSRTEMDLCVRWVLYACRPLKLEELYFAIATGVEQKLDIVQESRTCDLTTMKRFVLDCSKGLVEVTKTTDGTVQFIHETQRGRPCRSPQNQFLQDFDFGQWLYLHKLTANKLVNSTEATYENIDDPSQLYILARDGLSALVLREVQRIGQIEFPATLFAGYCSFPLLAALRNDDAATLAAILQPDSRRTNQESQEDVSASISFLLSHRRSGFDGYWCKDEESPLVYAARMGYVPLARCLLATGKILVDRQCGPARLTALMAAARSGKQVIARLLMEAGASLSLAKDEDRSPLVIASIKGFRDIVEDIIRAHTTRNQPIQWLEAALVRASENGQKLVVRTLLRTGVDINAIHDTEGTALITAARNYQSLVVGELLDARPKLDCLSRQQQTALVAVLDQDPRQLESFRTFLESGDLGSKYATVLDEHTSRANPVKWIPKSYRALLKATGQQIIFENEAPWKLRKRRVMRDKCAEENVRNAFAREVSTCRIKIVDSLLRAGANPNVRSVSNTSMVMGISHNTSVQTPLAVAAMYGYAQEVLMLLCAGARTNDQIVDEATSLILAAREGHESIVRSLIAAGADLDLSCPFPGTALSAAAFRKHVSIVRMLLESGADVNAVAGDFGSALIAAVSRSDLEIVQILLHQGANVNVWSDKYGTALQAARDRHDWAIEKLLISHSAHDDVQTTREEAMRTDDNTNSTLT